MMKPDYDPAFVFLLLISVLNDETCLRYFCLFRLQQGLRRMAYVE